MNSPRIEFLELVVDLDPKDVRALTELGWFYFEDMHEYSRAVSTLEAAVAADPRCEKALFWLAKAHYHQGSPMERARPVLEQALQVCPADPASAVLYASVCCELGDAEPALAPLQAALTVEPTWVSILSELDQVLTSLGKLDEAIDAARRAFRLASRFSLISTPESYLYFEACVTGRWVRKERLAALRYRAARRP